MSDEIKEVQPQETAAAPETAGKKRKKRKIWVVVLCVVLGIVVAAAGAVLLVFEHYYQKSNYVPSGETYLITTDETEESTDDEPPVEGMDYSIIGTTTEKATKTGKTTEEAEEETTVPALNKHGVMNVLLIGIDLGSGVGNSDAIIVCSINYDTGKIWLTSIMRDLEVEVPGFGINKINSTTILGGPTLLVDTVEQNFGIKIHHFALIDFKGMKSVVNKLGGVDIELTVAEAARLGIELDQPQVVHLNGKLALKYARDRWSPAEDGGSDFGRTQRQRNVLMAIVKKAKKGELGDLAGVADSVLPYVTHDFSRLEIAELITQLTALIEFDFNQQRIPYKDLYTYHGENLVTDLKSTLERFTEIVYEGSYEIGNEPEETKEMSSYDQE